jgi:hypothetical protein
MAVIMITVDVLILFLFALTQTKTLLNKCGNHRAGFLTHFSLVETIDLLPDKSLARLGKLLLETFIAGNLQAKLR